MTVPLVLIAWLLLAGAALAQDAALVPVTVDGQSVRLQMRIYKPPAPGPAPTLVFNHGLDRLRDEPAAPHGAPASTSRFWPSSSCNAAGRS